MSLRYEYFCTYNPNLYSRHYNGCHGNHEISKIQITFIFEDNIFLHLSGPIGQIYAHNKMSDVFNLGLITTVAYYSLPMLFSIILRFH